MNRHTYGCCGRNVFTCKYNYIYMYFYNTLVMRLITLYVIIMLYTNAVTLRCRYRGVFFETGAGNHRLKFSIVTIFVCIYMCVISVLPIIIPPCENFQISYTRYKYSIYTYYHTYKYIRRPRKFLFYQR